MGLGRIFVPTLQVLGIYLFCRQEVPFKTALRGRYLKTKHRNKTVPERAKPDLRKLGRLVTEIFFNITPKRASLGLALQVPVQFCFKYRARGKHWVERIWAILYMYRFCLNNTSIF
jgi:hypothetical protein